MTPGVLVTRDMPTVTSHCHYHVAQCQLDTWQIFIFF